MYEDLVGVFKEVPDPRRGNAVRHDLCEVLAMVVIAGLAECDQFTEIEMFCIENEEWLSGFMELPGGIPSHDTFGDVMAAVDAEAVEACFARWVQGVLKGCADEEESNYDIVAIDGKEARRCKTGDGRGPDCVSAYSCGNRLVLGQKACEEKSNEITAIPKLIDMLYLKGSVVTIDAMGTQKEITKRIVASKADYVLNVKGNQQTLLDDIKLFFEDTPKGTKTSFASTTEKSHGRIETRECTATHDVAWLNDRHPGWEKISGIGAITSTRQIIGKDISEQSVQYFIFSKPDMDAKGLMEAKRAHWQVENSLHWVLDMDFREDEARMRVGHAAKNMAVIRRICLNLLRAEQSFPKLSINLRRKKCMFSVSYREKVLGLA